MGAQNRLARGTFGLDLAVLRTATGSVWNCSASHLPSDLPRIPSGHGAQTKQLPLTALAISGTFRIVLRIADYSLRVKMSC